jgi:hypothetical protein
VIAALLLLAATPLSEVRVVPDTTVTLGATTVGDENVARDDFSTVTLVGLGAIPPEAAVDAYAVDTSGAQLVSFETTVVLPGGATARPGDVWRFDGTNYAVAFDAAARGVPPTANLDAVALDAGSLLLSFDTAFDIGGLHVEPEDLVQFDGSSFTTFFDGSAAGVAPGLNLDAAEYLPCNGHLLLSFDGSGSIGSVAFDDEDLLEFDRASTWQMAYDGSAEHAAWGAADLADASAMVNFGSGTPAVFAQKVTVDANKTTFRWPSSASFREVRGSFVNAATLGTYGVNATAMGTASTFNDATVPTAGTGYWYLVKAGGCAATSWQSALGTEAGRDAAIP